MRPPSRHHKFFSSLKQVLSLSLSFSHRTSFSSFVFTCIHFNDQVEKRLTSEEAVSLPLHQHPNVSSPLQPRTSTDDLGSSSVPIYLINCNSEEVHKNSSSSLEDSDPPREFLSDSPQFLPIQGDPPQSKTVKQDDDVAEEDDEGEDDVEKLIELLGLLDFEENCELKGRFCHSDDGFYSKIVGAKGPKCEKEVKRLDGWIKYLLSNTDDSTEGIRERNETLRIAHLLLGKAAAVTAGGDFGEIEFPSTIQEFLEHDPPA